MATSVGNKVGLVPRFPEDFVEYLKGRLRLTNEELFKVINLCIPFEIRETGEGLEITACSPEEIFTLEDGSRNLQITHGEIARIANLTFFNAK